jgi:Toxin SymE, type I toxin-antitoxin system
MLFDTAPVGELAPQVVRPVPRVSREASREDGPADRAAAGSRQLARAPLRRQDQHAMKPGRSAHAPEIREATNGGEQVMSSRLLSALHRHPKLSRPRRRAASVPQSPAVAAHDVAAASDSVALVVRAAATPKPRRARTPRCLTVHRVFRYTDFPRGETVPFLRLSGRWLEQRGFGVGVQVYVEAAEGRLILTNYKTHMAELFGSSE